MRLQVEQRPCGKADRFRCLAEDLGHGVGTRGATRKRRACANVGGGAPFRVLPASPDAGSARLRAPASVRLPKRAALIAPLRIG